MQQLFLVMLGSALGGMARFALSGLVGRRIGETFPWGTMAVNVSGAFAIGLVAALGPVKGTVLWPLLVTGFLGSYTTVSSFSLQTLNLLHNGQILPALANIALSLGLCLLAAGLGLVLVGGV